MALRWLRDCLCTHHACNEASAETWFPTRLIDLGDNERSNARLVCPGTDILEGVYGTVSYRWDDSLALRLLQSNIDAFRNRIPVHRLPPVLSGAVSISRRLGIRYLWIDSLCIIQDSRLDWQEESSQMGKIYSRAWLNLAANGTIDAVSQNMLFNRNSEAAKPIMVRIKSVWGEVDRYHLMRHTFWRDLLRSSSLSARGWIFQERLLSRRVLHFGGGQLLWECREQSACETWPGGLPLILQERAAGNGTKAAYTSWRRGELGISLEYQGDPKKHMRIWQAITEEYSGCDLTRPEDKLIALSGIAEEMSLVFKDDYLGANWRSQFPEVLMWAGGNSRPRPLRAPTWSWASVDGRIRWHRAGYSPFVFEVLSIETRLSDSNPHLTSNLTLRIRGKLFELEWKRIGQEVMIRKVYSDPWKPCTFDSPVTSLEGGVYFLPMTGPGEGLLLTRVLRNPFELFERIGVHWQFGTGDFHASADLKQAPSRIIDIG